MVSEFSGSGFDYAGYVVPKQRVWSHESVTVATQREADAHQNGADGECIGQPNARPEPSIWIHAPTRLVHQLHRPLTPTCRHKWAARFAASMVALMLLVAVPSAVTCPT